MEPPPINLSKETCNGKSSKDFVNLKLHRDPTSSASFYHGEPETFLLFIRNFNMTLAVTGTLEMDAKIQYICTLVSGESFHHFELLSTDIENIETLNVDYCIKGLALYFFPVNSFSKKRVTCRVMKNAQPKSMTLCGALH